MAKPNRMSRWLRTLVVLVVSSAPNAPVTPLAAQVAAQPAVPQLMTKAIRFGRIVDGSGAVLTNAVVIVEGDRIMSISSSPAIPANATYIDLSRYTAIPGMIDMHTHLAGPAGDPGGPTGGLAQAPNQVLLRSPVMDMFQAQGAPQKILETGVTSVRNLGAYDFMDIAMRDLINQGALAGPRMFVSGPIMRSTSALGVAVPEATADGPVEMTRVVRRLIAAGADCIKIMGTTTAGPPAAGTTRTMAMYTSGVYAMFTKEELQAAVEVAHGLGKKVAIHTFGENGARDAVQAGADSIEHGSDMDDATMAEMARRGTTLVPTIYNSMYTAERVRPQDKEWFNGFANRHLETAKRAFRAGVKFAMGSDVWATYMLGENTQELGWFVKAGMTPAEALAAATTNAAALLGKERELGMIAPGFFADIVAVDGDPLKDIGAAMNNVRWVMKAGAVVFDKAQTGKLP
jgi:imidazolonepropionase-like amidohydrolase